MDSNKKPSLGMWRLINYSFTTRSATTLIENIKRCVAHEFEMKNLAKLHYCLELEVWRDNGRTLVKQRKYAHELMRWFNMNGCKSTSTSL